MPANAGGVSTVGTVDDYLFGQEGAEQAKPELAETLEADPEVKLWITVAFR